jgi:hypothetical protein
MADWLPDIDIAVRTKPRSFLEQMAQIGLDSGRFDVEQHFDCLGEADFDIVNFRFREPSHHCGLGGQLIGRPDIKRRVILEMRAERWSPDPPTRSAYCDGAEALMQPLLSTYNRANATRYRLWIGRASRYQPKPTTRTAQLLDRFVLLANKASLHPLDWKRFYMLVREGRQELTEDRIRQLLIDGGFAREKAERLADIYVHLWTFKRLT